MSLAPLRSIETAPTTWVFRLYIAGQTPRSLTALANLRRICEQHLQQPYRLEVIDLMIDPSLASEHQIVAIPTLVRLTPLPARKLIGDLSDWSRVVTGLELIVQ